ncbi:hypothetical protein LIER_42309 [Lithospermum erythrorhizon]|uniref:Protein kinase domain-containing protein n=1 Tax=Lithospermum erythrorhizon TaxID=34254 RepID=A0AAV3RR87_LITER
MFVCRGYMAPEYALWGHLTFKADVYSFGVVALEIVAGMSNMNYKSAENFVCLIDKALVLQQADEILELVDPKLGSNYNVEEATRIIKVALLCTNPSPALRPTMSSVVSMFEGKISIQENVNQSLYEDPLFKSVREKHARLIANNYSTTTRSILHSSSSSFPYDGSSTSGKSTHI